MVAGAKKESFKKVSDSEFHISVREKAEQNLANKRILELVREKVEGVRGSIKIVSGHHSPTKIISVEIN